MTLDLSGNALHFLPLGLPRSLQVLRVKDNQLNSIPEGALQGMTKLRDINLSHNQLRLNSIYQGAWMELSALTVRLGGGLTQVTPTGFLCDKLAVGPVLHLLDLLVRTLIV